MPSGTRKDGSPTDIGSLKPSDDDDAAQQYTVVNRILQKYHLGIEIAPNQEVTLLQTDPAIEEAQPDPVTRQYLLKAVLPDQLLVALLLLDENGETVEAPAGILIAKPPHLRQTTLDGETVDDIEYSYILSDLRVTKETINSNVIFKIQEVEPPYLVDVDIIFASTVEFTGVPATQILDDNLAARRWSEPKQLKAYTVEAVLDDVLAVQAVDEVEENPITVAKAFALQRTPFDGIGGLGFSYVYTSAITRTVNGTEDQVIIPQFDIGHSLVYIMEPVGGTGVILNGEAVLLQDINVDGRMWAALPEDTED